MTVPPAMQNQRVTPPQANVGRIGDGEMSSARSKDRETFLYREREPLSIDKTRPVEKTKERQHQNPLATVRRQHAGEIAKLEAELRRCSPEVKKPVDSDPIAAQLIQRAHRAGHTVEEIFWAIAEAMRNREGKRLPPITTWGYWNTVIPNNLGYGKIPPRSESDSERVRRELAQLTQRA